MNLSIVCWNLFLLSYVNACETLVGKIYSRANSSAVLQFSADLKNLNSPRYFEVKFYDGSTKARIEYQPDGSSSSEGIPGVSITGDTAGNVVVKLDNVQKNNSGVYLLSTAGFSSKCNCLYILGTPLIPTITKNRTPSVGESVTLTCSSTSTTTPSNHSLSLKYDWTVDNTAISGGTKYSYTSNRKNLTVNNIVKEDANKQFTCTASEDVTDGYTSSSSDQFSFTVYYGPDKSSTQLLPSSKNYTKNEGENIENISCSADCYPACIYTWSKTRQGQTETVSAASGVLSLGILHRDDAALYTCTAKNPGKISSPTTTKQTEVNVRYGPDSAEVNKTFHNTVTEGNENVNVECNADCYPGCSYKWINNTSSSLITLNRILHFDTVTRENAGDYTCLVTNSATSDFEKSAETTIKMIVQYAPDVNISLSKTTIKEGENLALHCNGHGVPSIYTHTSLQQSWNNIIIPNNNAALGGTKKWSSLYFISLRLDDTGTYTCTLNNGITNRSGILDQSGSKTIIVQVAPKVLRNDCRFTGSTGDDIRIEIPIYSEPKHDSITLTRYDSQSISKDSLKVTDETVETTFYGKRVTLQGKIISLVLNDTKEEDFGNYSLRIRNSVNITQVYVYVIAEGPPLAPKLFQFLSEKNILAFVWQKNFNGGLNQYFVIETSIVGTEIWTNQFNVSENDSSYKMNSTFYSANVTGLSPGKYIAHIYAFNTKGASDIVDLETSFDIIRETDDPEALPVGIIAGVTTTVSAVLLVGVIVLINFKRRRTNKDGCKTKLESRYMDISVFTVL